MILSPITIYLVSLFFFNWSVNNLILSPSFDKSSNFTTETSELSGAVVGEVEMSSSESLSPSENTGLILLFKFKLLRVERAWSLLLLSLVRACSTACSIFFSFTNSSISPMAFLPHENSVSDTLLVHSSADELEGFPCGSVSSFTYSIRFEVMYLIQPLNPSSAMDT